MDFWLQRNGVPGNWCFQHGKKAGGKMLREHGDSFQASSLLTHQKIWRDEMPWIKNAETRIILFETGSKTRLRYLKVFGFFPRFRGWTFSSLFRFLFFCRGIGNGNSSDLMRGLQSFWAKPPYLKSCLVLASSHRMSAWCFFFFPGRCHVFFGSRYLCTIQTTESLIPKDSAEPLVLHSFSFGEKIAKPK